MKKLSLKNGMDFPVLLEEVQGKLPNRKAKKIILHDFNNDILAEIFEPDANTIVVRGVNCKPYEISAITEIFDNFNWYWDNLNQ